MNVERLERWPQPEHEALREHLDHVHDFGEKKLLPAYEFIEEQGNFPQETIREMGKLGWFGFTIPEEYGGWGMDSMATAFKMRTLAYWSPSVSLIVAADWLSASTIMLGGTEEQKHRVLPRYASGALGCFALTEPDAGSDARSLKLKAEKMEHGHKLNGTKRYITNAGQASTMTVLARTGPARGDISAFLLESGEPGLVYPGVQVTERDKWVFRGSKYAEIFFDDVVLSHDALLGREDRGFDDIVLRTLEAGRINIAAQAIGMAMWVYDEAYDHVHSRKQFGKTLWELPGVQEHFTEAKKQFDAVWRRIVDTAEFRYCGSDSLARSAAIKIKATETAFRVASELAHYFGGELSDRGCSMFQRINNIMMTCDYEGANNALRKIAGPYLNEDV